ncbi:MAG: prephenate dehydrogenase [Chloroflexota bacterium]
MEDGFSLRNSTVAVFGLGLMGGSMALALKGHCSRLIGFDPHLPTLELALSKGIIDSAEAFPPRPSGAPYGDDKGPGCRAEPVEAVRADLIILAAPVTAIVNLIQQLPSLMPNPCILMDLGSTKREIVEAMSALPERFDPVGGHPICGKEKLGLEHAEADLFRDAPFVVTPLKRTSQRAKAAIDQIISAIGSHPIEMTAEDHDRILATTSHLPFLLSSALAHSTPSKFASLVGSGFRSASRLAGTPSHMMMGVVQSNRENILNSIQTFRNSLNQMESALQNEDFAQLETLLTQSHAAYHQLITEN